MSGTEIVDFDLDPFDDRRIFVAGKDGLVKVFYVPEDLDLGDSRKDAINNIQPKLILDGKFYILFNRINSKITEFVVILYKSNSLC